MIERQGTSEVGWFPLRGSYEEAVLSWYEQIELSFRRRQLDAQRADRGARVRSEELSSGQTVSD